MSATTRQRRPQHGPDPRRTHRRQPALTLRIKCRSVQSSATSPFSPSIKLVIYNRPPAGIVHCRGHHHNNCRYVFLLGQFVHNDTDRQAFTQLGSTTEHQELLVDVLDMAGVDENVKTEIDICLLERALDTLAHPNIVPAIGGPGVVAYVPCGMSDLSSCSLGPVVHTAEEAKRHQRMQQYAALR